MPVERLDARQQLPVVPYRDQDLGVASDGGLEDREGPCGEFICLSAQNCMLATACWVPSSPPSGASMSSTAACHARWSNGYARTFFQLGYLVFAVVKSARLSVSRAVGRDRGRWKART